MGNNWKGLGEFHWKYCLSCLYLFFFFFRYEEKLVKTHLPSSIAPSFNTGVIYLPDKSNILSFNFLPILYDLWSEKSWGSSLALLPIWWADQSRPDWVNPPFSQVLIVSLGGHSVHFNREKNRKLCRSSPQKLSSPLQVSFKWCLSLFLTEFENPEERRDNSEIPICKAIYGVFAGKREVIF